MNLRFISQHLCKCKYKKKSSCQGTEIFCFYAPLCWTQSSSRPPSCVIHQTLYKTSTYNILPPNWNWNPIPWPSRLTVSSFFWLSRRLMRLWGLEKLKKKKNKREWKMKMIMERWSCPSKGGILWLQITFHFQLFEGKLLLSQKRREKRKSAGRTRVKSFTFSFCTKKKPTQWEWNWIRHNFVSLKIHFQWVVYCYIDG